MSAPQLCPQGTYGNVTGLTSSLGCQTCTAGLFCAGGSVLPTTCASGSYVFGTACALCPAAQSCIPSPPYLPIDCAQGTYRGSTGGSACYTCLAGGYCPSKSLAPTFCTVGYYSTTPGVSDPSTCQPCAAGYYCTGTAGSATTQVVCPAGSYCAQGSSVPTACPAGKFVNTTGSTSSTSCSPCPAGSYCSSPTGTIIPTPTPAGTYIGQTGAAFPCVGSDVGTCPPGGGFCTTGTNLCPLGATAPISVAVCPAGSYCSLASTTPIPCPQYTYKNTTGSPTQSASDCTVCPVGTFCGGSTGLTTPGSCGPGTYATSGTGTQTCNMCQAGYYCPGPTAAVACQPGFYNGAIGQSTLLACQPCEAGKYCPTPALTAGVGCPAGTYYQTTGASLLSSCVACTPGNYCPLPSANPSPCLPGYFSGAYGNSDPSNCTSCTVGNYCPAGSTAPTQCPSGTFRNLGGAQRQSPDCAACTSGNYCPTGSVTPTACPSGTTSIVGQSSKLGCRCTPGFYCTYTEHLTATITVLGNITDFINNVNGVQDNFKIAIAKAAGNIPVANVVIGAITPRAGRRLLSSDADFSVHVVVRNARSLENLETHLRRHVGNMLTPGKWSNMRSATSRPSVSTGGVVMGNL